MREQPRSLAGLALDPRLAGATFAELPEAARRGGISGVLVEEVERNSRAAQNGLRAQDVIVGSSGARVGDLASLRTTLSEQPPQLVLRILRGRRQGDLVMQ